MAARSVDYSTRSLVIATEPTTTAGDNDGGGAAPGGGGGGCGAVAPWEPWQVETVGLALDDDDALAAVRAGVLRLEARLARQTVPLLEAWGARAVRAKQLHAACVAHAHLALCHADAFHARPSYDAASTLLCAQVGRWGRNRKDKGIPQLLT